VSVQTRLEKLAEIPCVAEAHEIGNFPHMPSLLVSMIPPGSSLRVQVFRERLPVLGETAPDRYCGDRCAKRARSSDEYPYSYAWK
jgi:hypothetical protein